jgi:hypothetical protein
MPTPTRFARVVLGPGSKEGKLIAVGGKDNWSLVAINAKTETQPAERIYATRDGATQIHWIQDHKLDVNYVYVQGPDTARIELLLRKKLEHRPPHVSMRQARDATLGRQERQYALFYVALDKMDRGFDQETFDVYTQAMRDPDPFVRASAVLGAAYLAWPQLAEPMRPLATAAEPDDLVRKNAALLIGRLDKLVEPPP